MYKNTRNSRFLLCATLGGTYVAVAGAHGAARPISPWTWTQDTKEGIRPWQTSSN